MNWADKSVLVTGAGGFIGSHLTEKLAAMGANVTAFVKYNSRNDCGLLEMLPKDNLDQVKIIFGDLKDSDAVRLAMNDVDVVFHLGSLIAIPYSYIHPRETIETNILGTLNVLSAAKECNVEKIIHTSTSEVYGTAKYVPIDENHLLQGQSPYSASKIGADKIAESFYKSFDLPVSTIRPFNTYGPRQSNRAVIPTIITQALTRKNIFLGSLYPTRDYTFVKDTVGAFIKVAESPNTVGQVINVGSNFEISIKDLTQKIASIIGSDAKIIVESSRVRPSKSEVDRLRCDNTKAKEILDWEPKIKINEGLKKTIEWIQEHINLYNTEKYVR
jgi:NAD dependent epimerase/dehydratase